MLKKIPLHTFLFSIFPVLFIFQYNIHEILIADIIIPVCLSLIFSIVIFFVLRFFIGSKKSSLIITLTIIAFIIYANLHTILQENYSDSFFAGNVFLIPIFSALVVVGIIAIQKIKSELDNLSLITNIISITVILIIFSNILMFYAIPVESQESYFDDTLYLTTDVEKKRNVFFIIFDEYAGQLSLKEDFDFDNTHIMSELKERGFLVIEPSFSNYPNTDTSLPSLLNMNYVNFASEIIKDDLKDRRVTLELRQENQVMKQFQLFDYHVVSFYGGLGSLGGAKFVDEKFCSFGTINTDLRKNLVLTYMPISIFNDILLDNQQKEKIDCIFSTLPQLDEKIDKPFFAMAQLRLPHAPYIFDAEGNSQKNIDQRSWDDKEGYLEQVKYSNKKILELADLLIKNSKTDPVIILMSDHGYRADIDWENPKDKDIRMGFNNISAFYFPEKTIKDYDMQSGVNIFRMFFNTYFDTEFPILEDKKFWYQPAKPYNFIDVTEIIDKFKNLSD